MKPIINFIIIAILLYIVIAFVAWDIKWITEHAIYRFGYLVASLVFSLPLTINENKL